MAMAVGATGCTEQELNHYLIVARWTEGGRAEDSGYALKVFGCESGLQMHPRNDGPSNRGIAQINRIHRAWIESELGFTWEEVTEVAWINIEVAWRLRERDGWGPWSCAKESAKDGSVVNPSTQINTNGDNDTEVSDGDKPRAGQGSGSRIAS